ncbi:MAG: hypothetical protein BGO49_00665 [Planctomycetales bacterium 71-10]|nr:MAG: hypothetical protein BGO49_00665 [Planctomycetales bacterium 71-10]
MNPTLVKARELRIAADRRAAEIADRKARDAEEARARQKLVVDAIDAAFGGVRMTYGRLEVAAAADTAVVALRAGDRARHHISIEPKPTAATSHRFRIDGLGARVYDSIPELLDGLAEILAPELDLYETNERPVYLTPAERAACREIPGAFRPVKERHPGVDVDALLKKLADRRGRAPARPLPGLRRLDRREGRVRPPGRRPGPALHGVLPGRRARGGRRRRT